MHNLSSTTTKLIDHDDFDSIVIAHTEQRQKLEFKEDPVAMAWAVYRNWMSNASHDRWSDLESVVVTDEDRIKSTEIRKYYADRILVTILSGVSISNFRRKLYGVVTNSMSLEKQDIGLLYRLPYFYMEDLALDRVVEQTKPAEYKANVERITSKFTMIERVRKSRRSGDVTQFWLKSDQCSQAFMVPVKCDNPHYKFISGLLERPIVLSGIPFYKIQNGAHRGHGYYHLADILLAA